MPMPLNVSNSPDPMMTTTAQQVVAEQNTQAPVIPAVSKADKKRHAKFKSEIEVCKNYRRKLIPLWTTSIDYRRGKPFQSQSDEDTVAVNLDWSLTKTKQASLYSQTPQVRIDHPPQSLQGAWVATFERKLNDNLVAAGIESAMDECLPDCINAAGIGVALVSYESLTEDKEVPAMDMATLPPEIAAQVLQSGMFEGQPVPMEVVPQVVDYRYDISRVSPADFLWPINFTSADFNKAPWLGRSGRVTWAAGVQKWKLTEEEKEKICGDDRNPMDRLSHDHEKDKDQADDMVSFEELFYWEHNYDPKATSFSSIHHLVFVNGKEEPVVDEPWKGQKVGEQGLIGAVLFPIQVFALAYITDETIPPSDSAVGRPQVNEINKSRTQMIRQRERSMPVRWFDVNRIDPLISQGLMRGTWQNMIPVQGEGSRVIGEVARATMPQENFAFDKIAKNDIGEIWTIGPNQLGSGDQVETKGEANEISNNFQTRVGRERAKVAAFFVNLAEVLGGLMCLYDDPTSFGEGFTPVVSRTLSYSILADSTVLVDANQRLQRLNQFLNVYGKSGWVELEPVLKEIATLTGLDPNMVIKPPQPKPPVEPNISLRLTGAEDMTNPLMLAFMLKSGQAPSPELIEKAKELIQQAVVPPQSPLGGLDTLPPGPPLPPPTPAGEQPGGPVPESAPPKTGDANPSMTVMPKITKRSDDPSGGI